VQARTPEIQRLAKALESAGIRLDSVVPDLTGKSATLMIEGLIDGERRGQVLADLAIGRMRAAGKLAGLSRGADRPAHRAPRRAAPAAPGPDRAARRGGRRGQDRGPGRPVPA
jgi:hypothetical protein